MDLDSPILSVAASRRIDELAVRELGLPTIALMETAGRALADAAERVRGPVRILCGKGNNGGDGLTAARWLHARRVPVTCVLAAGDRAFEGDAAIALHAARASGVAVSIAELPPTDPGGVVIDALLGTGARSAPTGVVADLIGWTHQTQAHVLSADVPSGLNADTGRPFEDNRCVRAHETLTFGSLKRGLVLPAASAFTGVVHVAALGLPVELLERARG